MNSSASWHSRSWGRTTTRCIQHCTQRRPRPGPRALPRMRCELPADPTAFVLDFLPFEERVIRRDGVRLFNVTYFDGALAPLLDSNARTCRIKYDPRDMSAVFVELPTGGHLRLPCADLGRPAVTLWEQRAADPHAARGGPRQRGRGGDVSPRSKRSDTCSPRRRRPARRPDAPTARLPDGDRRRSSCGTGQRPTQRHERPRTRTMHVCLALSTTRPGRRSFCRDRGQSGSTLRPISAKPAALMKMPCPARP